MITYSIIQKSQLEGGVRLDAEYYQPEYLEIAEKLKNEKSLSFYIEEIKNGFDFRDFEETGDAYYIRTGDFTDTGLTMDNAAKVDSQKARNKKIKLTEGDILFTRKGNWGKADIVDNETVKNSIISSEIMLLRIKRNAISPYYLMLFLRSKYGFLQIERNIHGVSNFSITQEALNSLKIFWADVALQKAIENLYRNAKEYLNESQFLYSQAEDLLLEELGLKNFEVEDDLSYIVNLSDVKSARRADAEHFQPKYEKIVGKIKSLRLERIGDIAQRIKLKIVPSLDKTYKYIEISDISTGTGEVNYTERSGEILPANARIPLKGGELIVSKVRPTRGAIGMVSTDWGENVISSSAFTVFKIKPVLREYIFMVLRSIVGRLQLERSTTGTEYPTIFDGDVENILIPMLLPKIQQKIAGLVRKSHVARKEAKELLEKAKQKVESSFVPPPPEATDGRSETTEGRRN